jgi:hypothetical protein
MLKKAFTIIAPYLSLAVPSATVRAGSTIPDKSYWPSRATQSAEYDLNSTIA